MLMLLTLVPTGTASNAAPSMPPSEEFTGCRKKVTVRPATWLTKLRFGAWSPAIGQQFVDTGRGMGADAEEHVTEIRERIDAVRLAGGDERIESGDVFVGALVADKEIVLATERDGAEQVHFHVPRTIAPAAAQLPGHAHRQELRRRTNYPLPDFPALYHRDQDRGLLSRRSSRPPPDGYVPEPSARAP
jgi:hypothetical protein